MTSHTFPHAPAKLHLVGIGGIGMSALAQFFVTLGYEVSGSDRDLTTPAQVKLFDKLKTQGIKIFLQDGSGVTDTSPDAIIFSSAIEKDNPDFIAAQDTPRFHRSIAMAETVNRSGMQQIAIAGSCGKTSVTGWMTSALQALGKNPVMINGGYTNEFIDDKFPGNFKAGEEIVVYEADESDGSLVNFKPDCAVLLNLGIDHHEKSKLEEFFDEFLKNSQKITISDKLTYLVPKGREANTFNENVRSDIAAHFAASQITHTPEGTFFKCRENEVKTQQFGDHSASNALAVAATLTQCGFELKDICKALESFTGVTRRFDYKGKNNTTRVYDDYAHNVQKIAACIHTAQNLSDAPVIAAFQPHGYGPLGFMREALKEELKEVLRPQDSFVFLPVFYAGGTTSFSPKSCEVAEEYKSDGLKVSHFENRDDIFNLIEENTEESTLLVLGARDPSLVDWTAALAGNAK